MPTIIQLTHIAPLEGDEASVTNLEDGTVTVDWPDGTQRQNYPDGSSMITFPDFSVLNIYPDGIQTLNDVNGSPLDPINGEPLSGLTDNSVPTPPPTTIEELSEILEGVSAISDLTKANIILRSFGVAAVVDKQYSALSELTIAFGEALEGELSPISWFTNWLKMAFEVIKAIETEERGVNMRSWCYTVIYETMGMGAPPEPVFSGSLKGSDQDSLDQEWWNEGRKQAEEQLADGKNGVSLRNRVLLLIAKCNGDPASAITEMWAVACKHSGDDGNAGLLAAYPSLSWPQPTGA